jgi:glycerol kinase
LTAFSTKQHIIRAALEAICFQTRDILEAMNKDCGIPLTKLNVDGRLTRNDLLMQLQADISGIPVVRAQSQDITALGVAIAAGQAEGINVWDWDAVDREVIPSDTFLPTTTEDGEWDKARGRIVRSGFQKGTRGTPSGRWPCRGRWDGRCPRRPSP